MKIFVLIFASMLFVTACNQDNQKEISFYHWKSKANMHSEYRKVLAKNKSKNIYMHYFDIKPTNGDVYPEYLLRHVDPEFKNYNITPVVYIVNQVFTGDLDIKALAQKTTKLVDQISQKQFNKKIDRIQVDCDWTQKSKSAYFEFLKLLSADFDINVTIRLHQIKYKKKTGVPPVSSGTLMLYNVGHLKDKQENSILENAIVKKYITSETAYPMPLDLALPLFSQTVITNNKNNVKIIKGTNRALLENDIHFQKIDSNNFSVVKDTLYKGFYLSKNYNLKLEELSTYEVVSSYRTVKNSNLSIDEIIFYHLDSTSLHHTNLEEIISQF